MLTPTLTDTQLKENITALQKQKVSNDQVQSYVNNYAKSGNGTYVLKSSQTTPPPTPPAQPNFFQKAGEVISHSLPFLSPALHPTQTKQEITGAFQSGVNQFKEGVNQAGQINGPLQGFEAAGKIGAGIINTAFSPLAPAFKPISDAMNVATDKISNNQTVQRFANSKIGQGTARVAEDVGNLATIAQGVAGSKYAQSDVLPKVAEVPGELKNTVGQKLQDRYVNQNIKAWEEPTTTNKPGFKKATEIVDNAQNSKVNPHSIGETLTNNKLNVADHIENGAYATADTADQIRADAGKLSRETLRPSLQKADTYTPKTPVTKVIEIARANIGADTSITPGTKAALFKKLDAEQFALQRQYPQGMSLTDLHDNKITYDMNAKYSPVGDIATNNSATLNKAVADSLRKTLEKNAPADIPVKEFNAELQKQYQAANYLDEINGKKVPQSLASRLAKRISKYAGATAGNALGGGLIGGLGGYHIGGMVEGLLENIPNPVKNTILRNLEVSNPAVFDQVKGFLQQAPPRFPQLPPHTSFEMPDKYQNTPEKGSTINVTPAEPQVYRDPNSGQMQRGYKSTSLPDVNNPQAGFADFGQMGKDIKSFFSKSKPEIHPEDQQVMKNFIDEVRLNKKPDAQLQLDASRIAEHYGLSMPKTLTGLANVFDKYLTNYKSRFGPRFKGTKF